MDENKRGSFGSTIGFLLSAIGSAVGLGNIWGFPYKMGRCGGFTFLIVYLALAAFVGFAIMLSELAIGRGTGFGPVNAYKKISKKFKWIGWLAIIAPFLIMTFYSVLGGYCIYYMVINVVGMFSGMPDSSSFGALLTNPWASIGCMILFMLICYLINRGGVGGGIEKFNTIGMPALFVMLVIVIIRAWTLPNADVGLKYMFVPGYALKAGFFDKAPSFMEVLATAGGQMFFSLSLAMGAMITYGSYLGKNENLPKNSVIIVISDTLVAIMAGLAVIPAAVANGIAKGMAVSDIKLGGPNLLFATLQDVFHDMGTIGGIFGLIFYALVLIAAISSASGMRGVPFEAAYSASKFAVCGFAEAAARELGPRGIRINVVCPFYVRTPMTDAALIEKEELTGITVEESYKMEGDQVPLGRVAEPEDIAELLYFLVSDASRYVTGAIIPISGGTHCGYGQVLSSYDEKDVE